jgi:hypothetical protein
MRTVEESTKPEVRAPLDAIVGLRLSGRESCESLVRLAPVLQPPRYVLPARITVRPVYDPTFITPFVLAIELHAVTFLETFNARRHVNIVRNEKGLPRLESQDETLMARFLQVIGE